jgi:tetratricopeptide (TPR) repeat protein
MGTSPRRLTSSLHVPDSAAWRAARYYRPALAAALQFAYVALHDPSRGGDRFFDAYVALLPHRGQLLCDEQHLHLDYALALAYAGEEAIPQALQCAASAMETAERLGDFAAQAELGHLAGKLLYLTSHNARAYDLFSRALQALHGLEQGGVPADAVMELDLLTRLGWRAWDLGRFPTSRWHLDEAYGLRARWASEASIEAASISWLDAQLARVQGRPDQAVLLIRPAAQLLHSQGQTLNAARAYAILADSALDLVEARNQRGNGGLSRELQDPAALLALSMEAAERATNLAGEAGDVGGAEMAQLAKRRAIRLRRHGRGSSSGVKAIEHVMRVAQRVGDVALIGRALSALGDELAAQGLRDAARAAYVRARRILEEHDLAGLALWPRRAHVALDADDESVTR